SSVDAEVFLAHILPVKQTFDLAPVSARIDLVTRAITPEHDGRSLGVDNARSALVAAIKRPSEAPLTIAAFCDAARPRYDGAYLASLDVNTVLGAYDTYLSRRGDQARRGQNIDVASSNLEGTIVAPGETVSFNDIVGERSEEHGFQK